MKEYEKPEIYSEQLQIDTLRAQCCNKPNSASQNYIPEWWCPDPCSCPEGGTPSV